MIPESFIQDLLARVDIVDLVDSYVPLKKAGANYAACCPFHNEKSPSFTVSPTKQFYHCFGCGAHGTAIGFVMEYQGMGFVDAVQELASRAGMTVPEVVLKIFDEWAEAIEGADGLPAMADALSLPRKQGTATTARHASDMRNSVRIVRAVAIHLERMRTNAERAPQIAGRASEREAIRLAARDLRMAVSVVKGHWARWSASEKPPPAAPTTEGPTLESAWGLRPGGSP